ncbi:MAG: ADP-ribosylation factor-like protein [Candidatus Kariarchaeaceae archaeon]
MSSPIKLIFAGLDQAGKTTIYKATMEEMSVEELKDQRPTRGIERHSQDFLDTDFQVWDLGGQLNYRETYLSKPEVFNLTKALVFVVDIQDIDRLDEAYQYYVDILSILVNVDPLPKLYVLFHKFDPELAGKLKAHFYKATRLFRKADNITRHKFKGYATSIYSNTIDLAVKRILFENFEDFEEPAGTLKPKPKSTVSEKKVPATSAPKPTTTPPPSSTPVSSPPPTRAPPTTRPPSVAPAPSKAATPSEIKTEAPSQSVVDELSALSEKIDVAGPIEKSAEEEVTVEVPTEVPAVDVTEEVPVEGVEEKSDEMAEDEAALEEATPTTLIDLSADVVEKLTGIINKRMKESDEIVALSILSSEGDQALAVAKEVMDYERLSTLREVVSTLNPKQFFKDLTDIEYRGLGHFSLSDFDIYFARASDDYAIAVLATDVSTPMLQNAQRIVRSIRQGLGMVPDDEEFEDEDDEEKPPGKKDLVADLRGRLKALSGLDEI